MDEFSISMFFDILVILLLGATIFYAARLSIYLKTFRDGRSEFEKLIKELSASIVRAEGAIQNMKETAGTSGEDLQQLINNAKGISKELQLMNEVGGNLADRLEKISVSARKTTIASRSSGDIPQSRNKKPEEFTESENKIEDMFPAFNIKDPEFLDGQKLNEEDEMDWEGMEDLQSEAERELFRALKQKEKH